MSADVLPLFPLDVVLFPGMPLPLHIFEPRYKLMTRQCRERREPFGVLWVRPEGLAEVGCTAEIVKVIREYDDGRSDILTRGHSRFRLLQTFDDLPYLQGRVDYLDDEDSPGDEVASPRLLHLYAEVFRLLYGRRRVPTESQGELWLSFRLAGELPLDLAVRQQLLEAFSEADRQQLLADHLEAWLPQLERTQRAKQRAGGNGFGR